MNKYARCFATVTGLVGLLTMMTACAVRHVDQKQGVGLNQVKNIQVEEIDGETEIKIIAEKPIVYTAFKLTDPLRVVIDISQADVSGIKSHVEVNNIVVQEIITTQFGEAESNIGRIEFVLKGGSDYDTQKDGNVLTTRISAAMASGSEKKEKPVEAGLEVIAVNGEGKPGTAIKSELVRPLEKLPSNKAKTITNVSVEKGDKYASVIITGEGYIADYNAFRLGKPYRVVVDVLNVRSTSQVDSLKVNTPLLKTVRIGKHKNKVRFVLDVDGTKPPDYSIYRSGKSLIVSLGDGAVPPDGSEYARAGVADEKTTSVIGAAANKKGAGMITAINFSQLPEASRILVSADIPLKYDVKELSADKTAIDISDVRIERKFQRSLDTSEFDTPVTLISSYQLKGAPDNIVRVVVATRKKTKYHASQEGNAIIFDVERESGTTSGNNDLTATVVEKPLETAIRPIETDAQKVSAKEAPPETKTSAVAARGNEETTGAENVLLKTDENLADKDVSSGYRGQRVSLDYKDAEIGNVLRLFAEVSGFNVIAADDVKGTVTVKLHDVPWDQAFDIILGSKGLGMSKRGNVIRVAPLEKLLKEEETALTAAKGKEKLEPLVSEIIPVSHAPVSEMSAKVKSLLTERGSVTTDERSSLLILNDIERTITDAKKLIKELDKPTPQVLIEARIVEVDTNYTKDLGVQWGSRYTADAAHGNALGYRFPNSMDIGIGGGGGFALNAPGAGGTGTGGAGGDAGGAIGISFGSIDNTISLDLKLSALESRGVSKIISRPRVVTINKKKASIQQGLSIPFETTSAEGTQTQFVDASLKLEVTPEVKQDGSIILTIKASKNEPDFARSGAGGAPSISKKEAETEVLIKDGDTTVIGGIFTQKKGKSTTGIPFLSRLPFIGWLFRSTSTTDDKAELLIFVTPKILQSAI